MPFTWRKDPSLGNPTIVVVTDRTDLDDQISGTFARCGFPNPDRATSVHHLRELLSGGAGRTVTTTVQKFQDATAMAEGGGRGRAEQGSATSTCW
jgi:type I restriction enzyme R subunit